MSQKIETSDSTTPGSHLGPVDPWITSGYMKLFSVTNSLLKPNSWSDFSWKLNKLWSTSFLRNDASGIFINFPATFLTNTANDIDAIF